MRSSYYGIAFWQDLFLESSTADAWQQVSTACLAELYAVCQCAAQYVLALQEAPKCAPTALGCAGVLHHYRLNTLSRAIGRCTIDAICVPDLSHTVVSASAYKTHSRSLQRSLPSSLEQACLDPCYVRCWNGTAEFVAHQVEHSLCNRAMCTDKSVAHSQPCSPSISALLIMTCQTQRQQENSRLECTRPQRSSEKAAACAKGTARA